jgi:uncharacterized membrane protein YedE/YeeE
MLQIISALLSGTIFGFGLVLSQMINPARVIGFLDVTGRWDFTLLLVMAGALLITMPAFPRILSQTKPILTDRFSVPIKTKLDGPLIIGAILFGIGWGLGGFCPGPAIAALASGSPQVVLFVAAMIAGQWLASRVENRYGNGLP